jgi:hypothetical protein
MKWAGHIVRMNGNRNTKRIFNSKPMGTSKRGGPNLRWIDCLERDPLILRTRNWRTLAETTSAWKKLLEKARAHPGQSSQ